MRRFSFKLEKVLELRRYDEREWEIKLAEVTSRVIGVENEIAEWGVRRAETTSVRVPAGRVDMQLVRSREEFVNRIDERVMALQSRLVSLEAEREKVRVGYLRASSRRKALSELKERRSDEYYKAAKREENRVIDEIAGTIAIRRKADAEGSNV